MGVWKNIQEAGWLQEPPELQLEMQATQDNKSLCLGSSVKGHRATRILQKAQNRLQLALETHMKAVLTINPQVALMTETQSSHVSLTTLWGHSNTGFQSLRLPSG